MRQPEVARAAGVLAALVLVLPLARPARDLVVAALFLGEFLTGGAWPVLSSVTAAPARTPLAIAGVAADRYAHPETLDATPLVLVHGLAPDGKDDPRLRDAAVLLARAGFDVTVPTIPGLARLRLRPDDVAPVVATLAAQREPAVVVGISVGAGVALLAAAEPAVRERVRLVVSLGGYASAAELIRFYLTGEYAWHGGVRGRVTHDPTLIRIFLDANADLLDPSARRVLAATSPTEVSASLAELSPALRRLIDTLSPERVVAGVRAPLVLVHGRDDIAVPYTESLRLAAARPADTDVVIVGVVMHVEGRASPAVWAGVRDMLALWRVTYRLMSLG